MTKFEEKCLSAIVRGYKLKLKFKDSIIKQLKRKLKKNARNA